jgi:hypothetical protein
MGADEEDSLARLRALRLELIDPEKLSIGWIVKASGLGPP